MKQISERLKHATVKLAAAGVEDPKREADLLMQFAIGRNGAFLIAHPEFKLTDSDEQRFDELIAHRSSREPFHYIIGKKEFYGHEFMVGPGVLIPRPETELLVEAVIAAEPQSFCEIGIGSGCISISILKALPETRAVGLEISKEALKFAVANAELHGVKERLDLRQSDVYDALDDDRFDLIVSNPPYIPQADLKGLQPEVREFEPHAALTDGADGTGVIQRIVTDAPKYLANQGWLLFEIGSGQAEQVHKMFGDRVWNPVEIDLDLAGIPRVVRAKIA